MKRFLSAWGGPVLVFVLGGSLTLFHLAHVIADGESLRTIAFGILVPLLMSLGVLHGGVWLYRNRSAFDTAASRRVGVWCLIGVVVLSLSALLTILYQRFHGVYMDDQGFVVLNAASFGALIGLVIGLYDSRHHHQKRVIETREQALQDLHGTTRNLIQTSDRQAIATHAVDAARDILELPLNACWLYDETANILTPVAATDEGDELVDELPTYTANESLSWKAFETGKVMVFDDVRDAPGRYRSDTPIRSEIILPLGDYGVMNIGSTEAGAFDEMDISLGRILAANTQTALQRADREQQLAVARDQTKQLNHQLTVLNRVFRHDLRNAANVIQGHANLLVADTDGETNSAETIAEQATDLVRMGEQVRDIERLLQNNRHERQIVDLIEVITTQLERVQRDYPVAKVDGPTGECAVYAHPLIDSAIFNVIENAVEHSTEREPRVEVTIADSEDHVTVQIADNGPGIPDAEVGVLERGYETPLEHTSGLGLWLVNWIVNESDGEVSFHEKSDGSVVCLQFEKANSATSPDD
ncbi:MULTISPECIES: GAF domain-containing protein [Halorussus]|uniref:GAF domain-containing protein n=1 Tax=Halorussus TaxID=1070314 RepID=UPI00209E528C|nr:GAF domain-containing protein [Halorussus vallis]USZ75006.1 GAF domain-containing protein [Halorussus vallis]